MDILKVEDALHLPATKVKEYHKNYLNSGLAGMLALLDLDKVFVRARGVQVWDAEGKEYLDFLGGFGSLNVGHNHPVVLAALEKVQHLPQFIQSSPGVLAAALACNLARITPGNLQRSFFGNSGCEAVEGALKLARAATGKKEFIYCHGSFHGKSFGALSVTGREKYQQPFEPLLPGCVAVPFGDADALAYELKKGKAAAFIVEPIQGEGGVIIPPPGYLAAARKLCSSYGALLIVDEVQTGFGRTGAMFACAEEGVVPDVLCLAKSLGGGVMPVGAFVTTDEIWKKAYGSMEKALLHTSTFGGNNRAAAAAIAAIQVILEENLVAAAKEKGEYLLAGLARLKERFPLIKDVRGRGLLVGIEFNQPGGLAARLTGGLTDKLAGEYTGSLVAGELLNKHGIITAYTLNNPNVIRLEPPLTVTREQIDRVLNALEDIFTRHKGFLSMAASGAGVIIRTLAGKK